jgi:hypothetical protein
MSKNEGLQIFVKMDLKCSTYGPEHKTERFRVIGVIVNFWEPVENCALCIFSLEKIAREWIRNHDFGHF